MHVGAGREERPSARGTVRTSGTRPSESAPAQEEMPTSRSGSTALPPAQPGGRTAWRNGRGAKDVVVRDRVGDVRHQRELVQDGVVLGPCHIGELLPIPRGRVFDDRTQLVHLPAGRWHPANANEAGRALGCVVLPKGATLKTHQIGGGRQTPERGGERAEQAGRIRDTEVVRLLLHSRLRASSRCPPVLKAVSSAARRCKERAAARRPT